MLYRITVPQKKKQSKYRNKKAFCLKKHKHDSQGEAGYCNSLHFGSLAKDIHKIETQAVFPLIIKEKLIAKHKVDFLVTFSNGKKQVHEFKGYETRDFKIKKKMFEELYPNIEYVLVKRGGRV